LLQAVEARQPTPVVVSPSTKGEVYLLRGVWRRQVFQEHGNTRIGFVELNLVNWNKLESAGW
jgi:hypothetical protein